MVKKYIVDSVKYWADEYHIDGFRFDLVGLIGTETINAVMEEVHKTHPNVIFYCSPDSVNSLKWNDLNDETYQDVYRYYQGLIVFRKAHPALRMTDASEVSEHITKLTGLDFNVTGFHITFGANGEENEFVVVFNPRFDAISVSLPEGAWSVYIDGENAGTEILSIAEGEASVEPISAMVLLKNQDSAENATTPAQQEEAPADTNNFAYILPIVLGAGIIVAVVLILRKRKA